MAALLLAPTSASAQDLPDERWVPARDAGLEALRERDWARAAERLSHAYDALGNWEREERFELACELAAALIRSGEVERGRRRLADGIHEQPEARVAACHAMAADALLAITRMADAAHAYLDSLAARSDPDVRARHETIDEAIRRDAARLRRALARRPLGEAIGAAADPETLAAALARGTGLARPTRHASCYADDARGAVGRILCAYTDAPESFYFGGSSYPLETFVWARRGGRVRVVAAYPSGTGYDCEHGRIHRELPPERLTRREHGVDGWLFRVVDGWEEAAVGDGIGTVTRTFVYACTRASGSCARVEESSRQCTYPETEEERERCSGYEGTASVRRGLLTIRIDRGELPEPLRDPTDLRTLAPRVPAARARRRSRAGTMAGCQVVVRDSHPPLNVRGSPSARAPVVGSLDDGTPVQVERHSHGRWVRLRAPLAGYVWSQNLQRRCE